MRERVGRRGWWVVRVVAFLVSRVGFDLGFCEASEAFGVGTVFVRRWDGAGGV